MSRLDQLISQYCPAGVPMVRLGEVATYTRGVSYNKGQESQTSIGAIPILRANNITLQKNSINFEDVKYIKKDVRVKPEQYLKKNDIFICAGSGSKEHVGKVAFVEKDLNYCFGGFMAVIRTKVEILPRFLYHNFIGSRFNEYLIDSLNSTTINNLNSTIINNYQIPLPPLPVQEEIVRILDAMSDLVTNLDAEISARQKQYEHARERLICQQNYEQVTFESLGEIVRGKRFVRNDITESGTPCIHYGDMYTYYGVSASEARTHLQGEIVSKMRYAKKNDVIIVGAGENNEDIGVALAWLGDQPAAVHDACYIISHEQNPVYISQYTRTGIYHEQLKKIVVDGKICSFPLKGLAQLSIPLPPLSVQQSIVERLDKMESLIQNLQAERALRQKQYEYYREKLLTFERT